ncbi:MAG TPA: hypothetical protein DDW73_14780 [Rhizobium sp.]|nr:hypothetical protein [Rhizobium sp.]
MTTLTTDTMTILNVIVEVIDAPIAGITGAMATAKLRSNITSRLAMKRNQLRASEKNKTVKVAPSGGDFTSLATAMAGTGAGVRFAIDGTYSQAGSSSPFFFPTLDDLEFAGVGQRKPVFAFTQAQNATLANITSNSTCDSHYNAVFRNLWMTAENARYVIHADASNSFFRKKTVFEECYLEHKGNESARAYVVANGGTSSDVWSNCYAVGAGIPDGGAMVVRNSVLLGYNADALHCHNWGPCEQPVTLDVEGCILDARPLSAGSSKYSFYWGNLGSLQNDVVRVVGNTLGGPVALGSSPWLLTDPAQVPANKMLASVTGYSNTPAPYVLEDDGSRALRITSATTGTSSSVVVSGTGADALFGGSIDVAGAVGLAGASYGYLDCGDHLVGQNADQAVTQIGKRLGNCSSVNKTLTVLIDGSTTKTVTFNQDYTSVSNTTILASINTALGSSATADLFNVNELFRPRFTDEERRVYNAGATTIKRKMAVAWATNGQPQSRIMTAADPLRLFAGIAYEDIRPGTWGRVKSAGMVRVAMDLLRSDSGAFVHGDAFGVGATDGQWVKSPGVPLLFAVNNADVRFGTFDNDTAWTSFTPTILSQTGTLTTAAGTGRWRRVGRQIHLQVSVTITTNGTGAGSVRIMNLPAVSAAAPYVLIGRESALNGKALLGSINSSSSFMSITNYDNSYPGADGAALNITGCYEAAA